MTAWWLLAWADEAMHYQITYETTVDESCYDTFLEDETMSVIIRYLSRGYIREVVIDIGRSALSSN